MYSKTHIGWSLVITLILLASSSIAGEHHRPTDGGTVLLGGTATYAYLDGGTTGGKDYSVFQASPTVGLFVFDHIMVGVTSFIQFESRQSDFPGDQQMLGGPVVGYYTDPGAGRGRVAGSFLPFVRAFFVYGSTLEEINHAASKYGAEAGVAVMLSNTIGLEILGRYSRDWISNYNEQFRFPDYYPNPYYPHDYTGQVYLFGVGFTAFL
jgi:hypothetical protein